MSQHAVDHSVVSDAATRRSAVLPFVVIGIAWIVVGGLVAAATAHAPTEDGTWTAAYLVLVAGLAQVALGVGEALLAPWPPNQQVVLAQVVAWNLSSAAIVTGTVADVTWLVDVGGVLLVAVLVSMLYVGRGQGHAQRLLLAGFRVLAGVLLMSIPIGLVLARIQ